MSQKTIYEKPLLVKHAQLREVTLKSGNNGNGNGGNGNGGVGNGNGNGNGEHDEKPSGN